MSTASPECVYLLETFLAGQGLGGSFWTAARVSLVSPKHRVTTEGLGSGQSLGVLAVNSATQAPSFPGVLHVPGPYLRRMKRFGVWASK